MRNPNLLLVLSVGCVLATPAVGDDLQACRQIADPGERLACYDQVAAAGLPAPEELFGLDAQSNEQRLRGELGIPSAAVLEDTAAEVRKTPEGKLDIRLASGQHWVQSDSLDLRIAAGDRVVIRPAALGSYLLQRNGAGRSIRVRRVDGRAPD